MRSLTADEITALEHNGCTSPDWTLVTVADPFMPSHYRDVAFSGNVQLGRTDCDFDRYGVPLTAGIFSATIHNSIIGDHVHIHRVANCIANYHIGNNSFIRNVDTLRCNPGATFGIGIPVAVLNETGGREVPIYEGLSSHVAYLLAFYRHDLPLIEALDRLVRGRVEAVRADFGTIGSNVSIVNCGTITDVNIGDFTSIVGSSRLNNGTIVSNEADPVSVGTDVIADDFILQSGSHVEDGALLRHSFVGQASRISNLFAAHDSLFFANCTCENGEAAAIFAGPYTVTMHKSSLLIAGMFSFLNAGSGSNQSNHMYKLGPIHQGIVERGSKTTSDSYILWPARIGAFSLVMGRHVSNPDTSDLPFSYLIENHGLTYVVPGANLKNVGTKRDEIKWPKRDRRRDPVVLDQINFNLLSPYTAEKMLAGHRLLTRIETDNIAVDGVYTYRGLHIRTSSLRKGRDYYAMAIDRFMGSCVLKRLEGIPDCLSATIRDRLTPCSDVGEGSWTDLAGLIAPISEITRLRNDIVDSSLSIDGINRRFSEMASNYSEMEWTWVASHLKEWCGKSVDSFTAEDVIGIIDRWLAAEVSLDKHLIDDAAKEFSELSRKGFGIDNPQWADADFESVRGRVESNPFVTMVSGETSRKVSLAATLKARFTYPKE